MKDNRMKTIKFAITKSLPVLFGYLFLGSAFGIMLYDMDFEENPQKPNAMFYRAQMKKGVIVVPDKDSEEVLR